MRYAASIRICQQKTNDFAQIRYLSNPKSETQMPEVSDYIKGLYERRGRASSGIIYCRLRKKCDEVAEYLRLHGLNARPYHRGVP